MTTSGAFTFSPSTGDLMLEAFGRIGINPPQLSRGQIFHALRSINYALIEWQNRGIQLFSVDQQTINLVQGQATYLTDGGGVGLTVQMLDTYFSLVNGGGTGVPIDRVMLPMGRTEYDEIPQKLIQAPPTRFWFQKVIPRQVTIWPVPDAASSAPAAVMKFHRLRRLQDANINQAQNPDVDYLFLDALADEMAKRLARKYAPPRFQEAKQEAKESWEIAISANREDAEFSIAANVGGYWPQ